MEKNYADSLTITISDDVIRLDNYRALVGHYVDIHFCGFKGKGGIVVNVLRSRKEALELINSDRSPRHQVVYVTKDNLIFSEGLAKRILEWTGGKTVFHTLHIKETLGEHGEKGVRDAFYTCRK